MDFEIKLIQFLQSGRSPFFDVSFQVISAIGSVLGVIAAFLLFLFFRKKLCFWYLFTYGFVYLAVEILRNTVQRVRPFNAVDGIANIGDVVTGFSFPSGHAACATTIAIFVGYFLFGFFKKKTERIAIVLSCSIYTFLVCLSRLYLGKHYLTDVLASVVVSAVICAAGIILMRYIGSSRKRKQS